MGSVLGPAALSPAARPTRPLARPRPAARKAHRYLNFDFILFYFISLLPRAGAVPPGTAALPPPRPPPRASLYYCNKCAYKGAGSGARWGWGGSRGASERGCNFPKPEPEGEWAGWRWRRGGRGEKGSLANFQCSRPPARRTPTPYPGSFPSSCSLSWDPPGA